MTPPGIESRPVRAEPTGTRSDWYNATRTAQLCADLATRASFLVVAWLMLADSADLSRLATVSAVQAAVYLIGVPLGVRLADPAGGVGRTLPIAVGADLVSALALAGLAFVHSGPLAPLLVGAAVTGLSRAIGDRAHDLLVPDRPEVDDDVFAVPPRELVARSLVFLGAAAVAALTTVLGAIGALWLSAMLAVTAGAIVSWRRPTTAVADPAQPHADPAAAVADPSSRLPGALAALVEEPAVRRFAVALLAATLTGQAAAVLAVASWNRDVMTSADGLGLLAGAFVAGLVLGGLLNAGLTRRPARLAVAAAGYLTGGGIVAIASGIAPTTLLVVAAAIVAGAASATVAPVAGALVSDRLPPRLRGVAGASVGSVVTLGLPIGAIAGAWLLGRWSPVVTVLVATGLFLVALLVPVIAAGVWSPATDSARGVAAAPRLPSRVSVTLAYTDGQWLVEVRRGRALMGSRHAVKSTEAMSLLALLDVPGVHSGVEEALTTDHAEASRHVERMRTELAELEAKLTGLTEMVEQVDVRPPPAGPQISASPRE